MSSGGSEARRSQNTIHNIKYQQLLAILIIDVAITLSDR